MTGCTTGSGWATGIYGDTGIVGWITDVSGWGMYGVDGMDGIAGPATGVVP